MRTKSKNSIEYALSHDDWSDLTIDQIAEVLGVCPASVHSKLTRLRKQGIHVPYKKKPRGRKPIY